MSATWPSAKTGSHLMQCGKAFKGLNAQGGDTINGDNDIFDNAT
jgi:hypothetical protein